MTTIPGLKVVGPRTAGIINQHWMVGVKFFVDGKGYSYHTVFDDPEQSDYALKEIVMPGVLKYYENIISWWWPIRMFFHRIKYRIRYKIASWRLT